jgi:hypothetical protein
MKKIFIGSDISNLKLDICLLFNDKIQGETVLGNREPEIRNYLLSLLRDYKAEDILKRATTVDFTTISPIL